MPGFLGTPFMFDSPVSTPEVGGGKAQPLATESTLKGIRDGLSIMQSDLLSLNFKLKKGGPLHESLGILADILENSAIARHSESPIVASLNGIKESNVTFNEKTLRWHDDQTNLMVKGSDPRVAGAIKPEPSALSGSAEMVTKKKVGLGVLAGFLEEISSGMNLVVHKLYNAESASEEDKQEGKVADKKDAKNEKKQTSILGGMWESLKESGKKSWLADNWGKLLLGITVLFAPLEWIKGIWEFLRDDFWPFFKEHPLLTIFGGIATWFIGGAFLSALGVALATSILGLFGGGAAAAGGVGLITTMFLGVKAAALGGLASPLAIIGAIVMAIFDGITGFFSAGDWGVSKIGGFLGGMFAGQKGWVGMFTNMGKWAVAGALLGAPFMGIGAIPGGLVGAAIGAIFNFIGGKRMAQAFDNVLGIFKELLLLPLKLAKFLWKWIIVKPFSWLFKKIASTELWGSMVEDWTKNWGKFKSDLKKTWDDIVHPFKVIWDFLVDPANVITGEGIMDAVGAVGAKLKEWVSSLIGMVPFGDYILPNSLLEWAGLKAAEAKEEPTDDTDTTQPATETVAKTKDEKARVKSNLATLDELQEEGGVLGMRDKGVDSKTQEAIAGIGTDDLRMAVFGAKHVGLDKKDPALVKAMAEELEKRTMAKDDTEATIMTKDKWLASDEYKKTFKGEGASTAVQEMEYVNYVEKMRGTAGEDLSSDAAIKQPPKDSFKPPKILEGQTMGEAFASGMQNKSVQKSLRMIEKGPRGRAGKGGYKRRVTLALSRKNPHAKALWKAMKPEDKKTFKNLDPTKSSAGDSSLKKAMREAMPGGSSDFSLEHPLRPAQDPNDKMETYNNIMKKNEEVKSQQASQGPSQLSSTSTTITNSSKTGDLNTFGLRGAQSNKTLVTSSLNSTPN